MNDKINPCPFCGSSHTEVRSSYVTCGECMADGPFCEDNKLAAIAAWNKAASFPAPAASFPAPAATIRDLTPTKPEPSRLEIAAMIAAQYMPKLTSRDYKEVAVESLMCADALIAEARKEVK